MTEGLVTLRSSLGAAETLTRLIEAVRRRGLTVFATIDHARAAQEAGLRLNPASLVIFGSPLTGTPLMRQAPTLAIDLPLKALVWEDDDGAAWLSYNHPAWLAQRHGLGGMEVPEKTVAVMAQALSAIADDATGPPAQ